MYDISRKKEDLTNMQPVTTEPIISLPKNNNQKLYTSLKEDRDYNLLANWLMDGLVMVLRNKKGDYLFAEEVNEEVYYTLADKKGEPIRAGNLPISLEVFLHCVYKAGYRKVNF